jgi:protein-S-isoprenylcysteine O-methyltransferase Ste14
MSRASEAPPAPPAAAPSSPAGARAALVRAGNILFRVRNALFPVVFVAVALSTKPEPFLGSIRADRWLDAIGIAIVLAGQALRAVVIGLAYIRRGGKDKKIYAETLVTEGFFAHCRNPLYVGNMLVFLGLFVVLNSRLGYLFGVPFFLFAYIAIVAAEEEFLGARFGGEYAAYCRRVNRFLPSLSGLGRTMRGMEFDWRRLVRKEYGSTFTWITTALALLVWERYSWGGRQAAGPIVRPVLVLWGLAVTGYLTARFLKKTGRLRS